MSTPNDFYQEDLAAIHHSDFGSVALGAAHFIIEQTTKPVGKKVVDLGCGSGLTAQALVAAGFDVTGVDYASAMVQKAQELVPEVHFVQSSLFDYDLPPCDVVSIIGEGICYLFDHKSSTEALEKLFQTIFKQLSAGGFLVFDFLDIDVVSGGALSKRFIERPEWSMYITLHKDLEAMQLTRDMVLFRKKGALYHRSAEKHEQRLYRAEVLKKLLQQIGFEVTMLSQYADVVFRQGHKGFFCQKPL